MAGRCVAIRSQSVLNAMGAFDYGNGALEVVNAPKHGARALQLVFSNGYVSGIAVGGSFLSYGVNMGRFNAGVWYRLPSSASTTLVALSRSLHPDHCRFVRTQPCERWSDRRRSDAVRS
jgi:hypothetical protein